MYDIVINNGRYFDGSPAPSGIKHLAIEGGNIVRIDDFPIDTSLAKRVIDAKGLWIMPGFIDTHTHYDAELLVSPGLTESLRHGVTTVMVGSCSLSMVCCEPEDASDIFTRVETVPREKVLPILQKTMSWRTPAQWVEHVSQLPLGPNLISMLGHSDLRTGVMGLSRATNPTISPTEQELAQMEALLKEAFDAGFVGLSTMRLKWDKVDGDREWSKSLPGTYVSWREVARLNRLVRQYRRVHQGAPDAATPLQVTQYMRECLGWLRAPLKTTLISQMDLKGSVYLRFLTKVVSVVTNLLKGDFRWQLIPTPFKVYADGIDVVLFEEFKAGELALDLRDEVERNALLQDEGYRRQFRQFYGEKLSPRVWQRDFGDAKIVDCPDPSLIGKNFEEIANARNVHVVDLFLDLVVTYGKKLRWYTVIGNHRPEVLKKLVRDKRALISFSDAGAHIRNMAFYNLPLRLLQLVKQANDTGENVMTLEQAVWRVTGDQADWFGIDAGYIKKGNRADIAILDPAQLSQDLEQVHWAEMQNFDLQRLVNRNSGLIKYVLVNGKIAVDNEYIVPEIGEQTGFGQFLQAHT